MLTSDLIRPFLRQNGRSLSVERLDEADPLWVLSARELIQLFQEHVGQARSAWESALQLYEGTRTDYVRIRGLAKVLTDAATFLPPQTARPPLELRERLFPYGPVFTQPDMFNQRTRTDALQEAAVSWGLSAQQVDEALFADLPEAYLLVDAGPPWTPVELLQRYNLELARGALYRATVARLEVYDNYKEIFRYLKLFKIMYLAEEIAGGGYRLTLSGPLSDFVETERYGVSFAAFLPALLLGERWQFVARVRPPFNRAGNDRQAGAPQREEPPLLDYRLDQTCGLHSYYKRGRLYDSSLERVFASEFTDFETKFGQERGKWRLTREEQLLVLDGTVMIPDFLLVHTRDERRRILIELVGFWSPRYLETKIAKVRAAGCPHLLLLVYENLNVTREDFAGVEGEVVFFKQKPVLKEVMASVEDLANRVYGPPGVRPPLPREHQE
jgi:uncharacterized protein